MVDLMLQADGHQLIGRQLEALAVLVLGADADMLCSGNQRAVIRNGQTAFLDAGIALFEQDFRIDKYLRLIAIF